MDVSGECPHCSAEIDYDDWIDAEVEADGDAGVICPACNAMSWVNDVFPEA